jgi:chloramphenicol O-acetyltransferase type A
LRIIDVDTWNRKQLFHHFNGLKDPYFGITTAVEVEKAYHYTKDNNVSFFGKYLHDCMRAINAVEHLKYRISENEIVAYDTIHASATIMRSDKTFGFSFIDYDEDLNVFLKHIQLEKERIENNHELYPPKNGLDCIHCSAIPWLNFTGHKEPNSGLKESVPKLAFGKMYQANNTKLMNVAISVNHALADGYHVGLFVEAFQDYLNKEY